VPFLDHFWLLEVFLPFEPILPFGLPLLFKVSKLMDEEFSTGLLEFKNAMNISGKSPTRMFFGHLQKSEEKCAFRKNPWFNNRIEGSNQPTILVLGLYRSIIAKFDFKPETNLQYIF